MLLPLASPSSSPPPAALPGIQGFGRGLAAGAIYGQQQIIQVTGPSLFPLSTPKNINKLYIWASQVALVVKNLPANAGDMREAGLICGSGRSPGQGPGNPLQGSCLESHTDRGAWWATVHRLEELDMTKESQHARIHLWTV